MNECKPLPLAALLADATVQQPRDLAPLARAVLIHQPAQGARGWAGNRSVSLAPPCTLLTGSCSVLSVRCKKVKTNKCCLR